LPGERNGSKNPATLNPHMDDTPLPVCQLATARMLQDQFDLRFPLVHAAAERPFDERRP
jgi:hypothetical protein